MTWTIPDFGPADLLTSAREGTRRLRVDLGRTGFFEGREFRTFYEYSVPSGRSVYLRATVPLNIILFSTSLTLDADKTRVGSSASKMRMSLSAGGTEGGTWSPVAVFPKNTMTDRPTYTGQVQIESGGTHSGGTLLDVVRLLSETAGSRESTVGGQVSDERGVGPGVYYYRLENIDGQTATGVFSAFWEERP